MGVQKSRLNRVSYITISVYSNTEGCKCCIALPQIYFHFQFISNLWGVSFFSLILWSVHSCDCSSAYMQQSIKLAGRVPSSILLYLLMFLTSPPKRWLPTILKPLLPVLYEFCYLVLLPLHTEITKGSEATKSYLPNASHWLPGSLPHSCTFLNAVKGKDRD